MSAKNVIAKVKTLLADWLPDHGYELWNVEFGKAGRDRSLNVYIDRLPGQPGAKADGDGTDFIKDGADAAIGGANARGGIGTDDCERVSKYLSERLDEEELIDGNYYLIVSSPGMDRPLFTDEHFARYKGVPVDVSLYKGVDGRKTYSGILGDRTDDCLAIISEEDGREVILPRELVSKVSLQVIF
jgi:ribosome maturation factor RimP